MLLVYFLSLWLSYGAALASPKKSKRPKISETSMAHASARDAGISIQQTMTKGLGAFATSPIPLGTWVGTYTGEFLTRCQVEARYWKTRHCKPDDRQWLKSRTTRNQGKTGDYLFDMGDDIFIDAEDTDISSWCRFMNHAAEDCIECNIETKWTKQVKEGSKITQQASLWFVTIKDIQVGEELLYDYGDSYWT
jgi:SET domain-containing protein